MKANHLALAALFFTGTVLPAGPRLAAAAAGADPAAAPSATAPALAPRPLPPRPAADMLPSAPSGSMADSFPVPAPPNDDPLHTLSDALASDSVHIGLPAVLEREPGVNDPVFSILTWLVTSGSYGTITQERLQQEVERIGGQSRLPYQSVVSITREPVKPGWTALIRLEFQKPIALPVPYSILGYHPGSFTASQHCVFREWEIGKIRLAEAEQRGDHTETRAIDLEDVHLFASVEGDVKIDIDAWIDALLGGAIDDTDITALMLGLWRGEWYGVAMGYGRDRGGRSGILSLRQDKILFPTPDGLRGVGRQMRAHAERLGRIWDAGGARIDGMAGGRLIDPKLPQASP